MKNFWLDRRNKKQAENRLLDDALAIYQRLAAKKKTQKSKKTIIYPGD